MQAVDRWRKWTPKGKKFSGLSSSELTELTKSAPETEKPSSVSFGSSNQVQTPNFSDIIPSHDPAAWVEDFHRWALNRCCFRDRCFGGIGALHMNFCDYQIARDEVPCQRSVFEALLRDAGFLFADGLVSGLILKADLNESEFRANTRASHPRERGKVRA